MTKIISAVICVALIANDQLIKLLVISGLSRPVSVIPGLFYLTYVENRGAAFGIFQGHPVLLASISIVFMSALLAAVLSGKIKENFLVWSITLIVAGGVGNCIDRLTRGFVVDYMDVSVIFGFPVFNFADCCVVVGTGLVFFYLLFMERKKSAQAPDKQK